MSSRSLGSLTSPRSMSAVAVLKSRSRSASPASTKKACDSRGLMARARSDKLRDALQQLLGGIERAATGEALREQRGDARVGGARVTEACLQQRACVGIAPGLDQRPREPEARWLPAAREQRAEAALGVGVAAL